MKWETLAAGKWAIRTPFDVNCVVHTNGSWSVYKASGVVKHFAEGKAPGAKRAKHDCVTALLKVLHDKQDALRDLCGELTELL